MPLAASTIYFFCLLGAYYLIRPVRDAFGVASGIDKLPWLFTATFIVMLLIVPLWGWAVRRYTRARLVPGVYLAFIAQLLVFYGLLLGEIAPRIVAPVFFVWLSVFNLFVVSVFWSFMSEVWSSAQARRLFGLIAAGGSLGAVAGPAATAMLVDRVGAAPLLLISSTLLALALVAVRVIERRLSPHATQASDPRGSVFDGVKLIIRSPYLGLIAVYVALYTLLSTFLYFEQARIVGEAFADTAARTRWFAQVDLAVNVLTLLAQVTATHRLVAWLGVGRTLALIPAAVGVGLLALAFAPGLILLAAVQIIRRAGNYALARPAREMLFTVVNRAERYQAKNAIDTLVYRGGDAAAGWAYKALAAFGAPALAGVGMISAVAWAITGLALGRRYRSRL
ncbi:MAG: hypothetical protein KDG50_00505 [Chromatiales bacterium]|nr:hypothetical protein [Chromatiales bacterium]